MFSIDQGSGKLYLSSPVLDFELIPTYSFLVKVSIPDCGMEGITNVVIIVSDVNDEKPVFSQDIYRASIIQFTPGGTKLVPITVYDKDQGDILNIELVAYRPHSLGLFHVDHSSRCITTVRHISADDVGSHYLIVIASDRGGLVSYALVVIDVENIVYEELTVSRDYLVIQSDEFYGIVGQLDITKQASTRCNILSPMHEVFEIDQNWNIWQAGENIMNSSHVSIICSDHNRVVYTFIP